MQKTWLFLDVSNAAHRAFHTTRELAHQGQMTGVLFGLFRDISSFASLFNTKHIAFFFDGGYEYRRNLYPEYKKKEWHKNLSPEEIQILQEDRKEMYTQIDLFRKELLPRLGFTNILWQSGVEADDLIASACIGLPDEAIIISTDNDLLQCITEKIICWNPFRRLPTTLKSFQEKYNLNPVQWPTVKAIAGCSSDNIKGVYRVGEITAIKFLLDELKPHLKSYQSIIADHNNIVERLKLTTLPCPGTMKVFLEEQNPSREKWNALVKELGMTSLVGAW